MWYWGTLKNFLWRTRIPTLCVITKDGMGLAALLGSVTWHTWSLRAGDYPSGPMLLPKPFKSGRWRLCLGMWLGVHAQLVQFSGSYFYHKNNLSINQATKAFKVNRIWGAAVYLKRKRLNTKRSRQPLGAWSGPGDFWHDHGDLGSLAIWMWILPRQCKFGRWSS